MDDPRTPPSDGTSAMHASRRIPALLAGYWAFGQYWGVWVILVANLNDTHSLTYGEQGFLLMLLSIVAVAVMAALAPRLARIPLGTTVPAALMTLGVGAVAMALLPTELLWLAFVVVGAGNGLIDVFMNVEAQRTEVATRKPVLQWMHACYALGGISGAAIGGVVEAIDANFRVGIVLGGLALFVTAWWNASRGDTEGGGEGDEVALSLSAFRRHRRLWVAGLVVLFAFLVEGSMDTWSGLYLREQVGASAAGAALAFAAFSAALFLGRMFAGRVLFGLGPRATILTAGIGAGIGGGTAAFADSTVVVAVGFLLMGFSIAAAAPAGYGLIATSAPNDQANAVAAVTTVGYSGFVWSPPIFGWIADSFDLRTAMAVIVSSTLGIVIGGLLVSPRKDAGRGRDLSPRG
jgi:MFS family permease